VRDEGSTGPTSPKEGDMEKFAVGVGVPVIGPGGASYIVVAVSGNHALLDWHGRCRDVTPLTRAAVAELRPDNGTAIIEGLPRPTSGWIHWERSNPGPTGEWWYASERAARAALEAYADGRPIEPDDTGGLACDGTPTDEGCIGRSYAGIYPAQSAALKAADAVAEATEEVS
jgi:hypothetical protein